MYIQSFQNAAASKITVTATATNIFDLINTAGSTTLDNAGFSGRSNAIIIQPEDGDIRVLFNGQIPTATNGFKITAGSIATLANVPLKSLKLIRTSANVVCSIQVGITDQGESTSITGSGGGAVTSIIPGTGATNLGKAEDSAHTSGDVGVQMLAVRQDAGGSTAGTTGDYAAVIQDANGNEFVTEGTTSYGEDYVFNVLKVQSQGTYTVPLTASALVKTGAGQLFGFVVNSCAAGATLKIWDNTSAATTVLLDTMTFTTAVAEGPKVIMLPAAVKFNTGCYFTIAVAAMSVTPIWN